MANATSAVKMGVVSVTDEYMERSTETLASETTFYQNAIVGVDSTQYICKGDDTQAWFLAGVVAGDTGNQTLAAGTAGDAALKLRYQQPKFIEVTLASVAVTDIGKPVYALYDNEVTLSPSSTTYANRVGWVEDKIATNIALVRCDYRPKADAVLADDGYGVIIGSALQQTISNGDGTTSLVPEVQVLGSAKADASVLIASFSTTDTTTVAPSLNFLKSGNATIGSNTTVASGEVLGEVNFFGADGTDFKSPAAQIAVLADTTVGTGDMPGRISFFTTADGGETLTEALRITSSQDVRVNDAAGLIVGSTSAQVTISDGDGSTNLIPEVQVLGTAKADGSLLLMVNSATATSAAAPSVNFAKSAHATLGSNTVVASGEILGEINFFGADGTDFESCAARIHGAVNTTPGAGDMPGRIVFSTSSDGAETLVERMRIAEAGVTLGLAGTTLGKLLFSGNTAGTVTVQSAATAGDWTLTLPPDDGDAGEQLQTNGSGVTTWEAAGSLSTVKNVLYSLSDKAADALDRILHRGVYAFQYKEQARPTTGDYKTVYHGVMAEEYPEVMHHNGRIFSPVSAFGEMCLAIKALAAKVERLEAQPAGA